MGVLHFQGVGDDFRGRGRNGEWWRLDFQRWGMIFKVGGGVAAEFSIVEGDFRGRGRSG